MLKIQMLEQIVANENVSEDGQIAATGGGASNGRVGANGSANIGFSSSGSSKDENGETRSLNRSNRLSPQGYVVVKYCIISVEELIT